MSFLEINGGRRLYGTVSVQGAKNEVLPMMAAALLNKGVTNLENVPYILDVCYMIKILNALGCRVKYEKGSIDIGCLLLDINGTSACMGWKDAFFHHAIGSFGWKV